MINIKQSKFSKISNLIFLTATTFIISFIWINYYIKSIKYSFISSLIISLCFFTIYLVFKYYQNRIYSNTLDINKKTENLKFYLLYSNYKEIKHTISSAYKLNDLISTKDLNHYIDSKYKKDIYFIFNKETIDKEDIISVYKTRIYNDIEIFCIDQISEYPLIEDININCHNLLDIKSKIIENDVNIINTIQLKKTAKPTIKSILCIIFNKSKSKQYFFWGLTLIIISGFTAFYVYYNIIGSILLLLSLYSRFNKKFN